MNTSSSQAVTSISASQERKETRTYSALTIWCRQQELHHLIVVKIWQRMMYRSGGCKTLTVRISSL
eukprot:c28704_g1_i4 orf=321-518(+)